MGIEKNFSNSLIERVDDANKILKKYLPSEEGYASRVAEAINYSATSPGKRLRPILMKETYKMYGGKNQLIEPFMAAIEMIHNYSLVHDDLPAMDNDEYRRGRKTTHAVYGAGMATLAGDGLLNLAFETALSAVDLAPDKASVIIKATRILGEKAGIHGMLGGQAADVDAEDRHRKIDENELQFIHENKTAALLEASLMIGAVLAEASDEEVKKLEEIGKAVGVAFQIRDDILDVTGDEKILGKHVGSDAENQKSTYVTLHGLEKSQIDVETLSEKAIGLMSSLSKKNMFLDELIEYLIDRVK
ncbi:geranylgeranyl diphosphate synthase, type II [Lachnospiraceae bacterium KH1T2]|nr:geranylgeranyl diphosphate synthase, type II [Lachnospiraceae bacterium KH1T2]